MRVSPALLAALAAAVLLLLPASAAGQAADPVVAAAGDIACSPNSSSFNGGFGTDTDCRQRYTSDILVGGGFNAVLALGDIQYENGEYPHFLTSYDPSWGRVKSITRPAIGNHEYHAQSGNPEGSGYFDYFNGIGNFTGPAGDRDKGYYSFNIGSWHVAVINSMCERVGGCEPGSPQERWLREDLFANRRSCTLAYWHHPLYSSGDLGNYNQMRPIFQALYDAGAELVLSGHDHNYERFAPQDASGAPDPAFGVREFVVGTGGKSLREMGTLKPNSEVRQNHTYGVLSLALRQRAYEFRFIPEAGRSFADSGRGDCHAGPPGAYPAVVTGRAALVTDRAVTLAGTVNPRNQPTSYRFQWGRTRRFGQTTRSVRMPGAGAVNRPVSARLPRQRPRTRIYYRLVATNAAGTRYGPRRTVRTFAPRGAYARAVARTAGLAAYWRLGERRGRTAVSETRSYQATYRGRRFMRRPGVTRDRNGSVGFGRGEVVGGGPLMSAIGSVEGWFQWGAGSALMRDNTKGGKGGWILGYDDGGRLAYRVAGKSFRTRVPMVRLRRGWHHYALVKNGANVALYVDGRRVHRGRGVRNRPQRRPWHVMRNGTHKGFSTGRADEIAIYNAPLSGSAVRRHYRLQGRR
jgi:acid phosphatase type 7